MTNENSLFDDAQPIDDADRDIARNIVIGDGTVVLGHDPFSPIDSDDVSDDPETLYIADSELVEY